MSTAQRGIIALLSAAVTSGCSTTYVAPSPAHPTVRAAIDTEGAQRTATIARLGQETAAYRLHVSDESLVVRTGSQPELEIPHDEVRHIEFTRRGKGALDGALIGLGVAAGTGLLTLADDDDTLFSGTDGAILVGVLMSVVTVPAGAILGAVIGHRVQFQFEGN